VISHVIFCSSFPNRRLGEHKMRRLWPIHGVLPLVDARLGADDFMLPVESPKEDLGRPNQPFRIRFPGKHFSMIRSPTSSTHALEKCFPWKRIRKGWFGLPKSSLGWVDLEYRNGNDLKTRTVKYGQTPSSYITKLTKDANGWAW